MFPSKRRKRYRDYLEPGSNSKVPDTTKRRKTSTDFSNETSNEDGNSSGLSRRETGVANRSSGDTLPHCDRLNTTSSSDTKDSSSDDKDSLSAPENENRDSHDSDEDGAPQEDSPCASRMSRREKDDGTANSSSGDSSTHRDGSNTSSDTEDSIPAPKNENRDSYGSDGDGGPPENSPCTSRINPNSSNAVQDAQQRPPGDDEVHEQLNLFTPSQTPEHSVDSASSKPKINYVEKYQLDERIGPVTITKSKYEVLVMIFHIVMRHGMTGKLIEDMLKFVNELLGKEFIPTSKYLFNKFFEPSIPIQFHFYCERCQLYLGERGSFIEERLTTVTCTNCNRKCNVHNLNGTDFFVTIPLKPQLELLAKKPGIEFLQNESKSPPNLCDVVDGELFKSLYAKDDITVTFNSDGAEAFHTGQYSLWPLQAYVNNLSPSERFRGENILVCGLWFGKSAPNFHVFLKAFTRELRTLAEDGINIATSGGDPVKRRVFASKCSVDSVARPKLQENKQFNGKFGCGYCLHPGDVLECVANNNVRYSAKQQYPLRSDSSMRADMFKADELKRAGQLRTSRTTVDHVNGLKGLSALLPLPRFAICRGFVIDYMHGMLLGATSKIVELLYQFKRDCVKSGKSLSLVDVFLTALTPPSCCLVRPRPLSKFTDFKAKEFRALLLYYLLPCTQDVLKDRYYNNIRDFVKAIFILLKDFISPAELDEADRLLQNFVKEFNSLYGDVNMTYNIHLCTHLVLMVRCWGPLWCYSNFCFESGNGNLLKLNEGTRGLVTQLALKYCMSRTVGDAMSKNNVSADVLDFCSDVVGVSYSKAKDFGSVKGHGEKVSVANEEEKQLLSRAGLAAGTRLVYFNRAIRNGIWFYSRAYTKPKVFDDSCVCLKSRRYARIWKIVELPNSPELYVIVNLIRIAAVPHLAPHIKICSGDLYEPMELIPFKDVETKCAFLRVENKAYVCDIANFYEVH